jgi:hypothetical protein
MERRLTTNNQLRGPRCGTGSTSKRHIASVHLFPERSQSLDALSVEPRSRVLFILISSSVFPSDLAVIHSR